MISVSLRSFTDQLLVSTKARYRQNSSRLSSYRTAPPLAGISQCSGWLLHRMPSSAGLLSTRVF